MNNQNKSDVKMTWKSIRCITVLYSLFLLFAFLIRFILLINNIPLRLTVFIIYHAIFVLLPLLFCYIEKRPVQELGFTYTKFGYQILIGILLGIGLNFIIGILPILIGGKQAALFSKTMGTMEIVYQILINVLFVGVYEELIFRGYIQANLDKVLKSKHVTILIVAILFALAHVINGTWMTVLGGLIIGLIFGYCRTYLKNCSLLSLIIAHGLYNALFVILGIFLL